MSHGTVLSAYTYTHTHRVLSITSGGLGKRMGGGEERGSAIFDTGAGMQFSDRVIHMRDLCMQTTPVEHTETPLVCRVRPAVAMHVPLSKISGTLLLKD